MNNLKKIGLTALAASLVSVSAHAGEMSVSGGASLNASGFSGEGNDEGTSFTMGNQLTFTGGGELDNGLTVGLSFVIDQGDDTANAAGTAPFDSHSMTISSDAMGSLKFSGEGGNSTVSAIGTAAGNLWDAFDQEDFTTDAASTAVIGDLLSTNSGGDDSFYYTAPAMVDGVAVNISYNPASSDHNESELGYGVTYTGVEGLTVKFATQDVDKGTEATSGDQSVYMGQYAYGPITLAASYHELDINNGTAASTDETVTSYKLSYTVNDALSISYGLEEVDVAANAVSTHDNAELDRISVAYTAGGMTLSGSITNGDNLTETSATEGDQEAWTLGASFAF